VYVTAFDLEQSFGFNKTFEITGHALSDSRKEIIDNCAIKGMGVALPVPKI